MEWNFFFKCNRRYCVQPNSLFLCGHNLEFLKLEIWDTQNQLPTIYLFLFKKFEKRGAVLS